MSKATLQTRSLRQNFAEAVNDIKQRPFFTVFPVGVPPIFPKLPNAASATTAQDSSQANPPGPKSSLKKARPTPGMAGRNKTHQQSSQSSFQPRQQWYLPYVHYPAFNAGLQIQSSNVYDSQDQQRTNTMPMRYAAPPQSKHPYAPSGSYAFPAPTLNQAHLSNVVILPAHPALSHPSRLAPPVCGPPDP